MVFVIFHAAVKPVPRAAARRGQHQKNEDYPSFLHFWTYS